MSAPERLCEPWIGQLDALVDRCLAGPALPDDDVVLGHVQHCPRCMDIFGDVGVTIYSVFTSVVRATWTNCRPACFRRGSSCWDSGRG
jgi:hypothetical protein